MRRIPLLIMLLLLVAHVRADVPADQAERARLLRELDEQRGTVAAPPSSPAAELPAARIDVQTLRARQELQYRTGGDQLWRQTLGHQQAGKIREQVTGMPSTAAAARAMGAERTLRMQDLSSRILQQDLQYRRERQNMNR